MSDLIADQDDSGRHGTGERTQDSGRHGAGRVERGRAESRQDTGSWSPERYESTGRRAEGRHDAAGRDSGRHGTAAARPRDTGGYESADRTPGRRSAERHDSGRHAVPVDAQPTGRRAARRESSAPDAARYDSGRFSSVEEAARAGVYDTVTGGGPAQSGPAQADPARVDPGFGSGATTGARPSTRAARRAEAERSRPSYDTAATTGRRRRAEADESAAGSRRSAEEPAAGARRSRSTRSADTGTGTGAAPVTGRRRADRTRGDAAPARPADVDGYQVSGRYGTGPNPVQSPTGTGRYDLATGTGRPDPATGTGRYDAPGGTGRYEAATGTGRYDAMNGTGRYDAASAAGRPDGFDARRRPAATGAHPSSGPTPVVDSRAATGSYDQVGRATGPNPTGRYDRVVPAPAEAPAPPAARPDPRVNGTGRPPAERPGPGFPMTATGRYPTGPQAVPGRPEATGRYAPAHPQPAPNPVPPPAEGTGRYAAPVPQATGRYAAQPGGAPEPYATGGYPAPGTGPNPVQGTGRYPVPPPGGYGPADATAVGGLVVPPPGYGPADATAAGGPARPVDVPVGAYSFADNHPGTGRYPAPGAERPDLGRTAITPPVDHTGGYPVIDQSAQSAPAERPMRASAELVPVRRPQQAPPAPEVPQPWQGPGEWSGRFPAGAATGTGGSGVRTLDLVKDYGSGSGAVRALAGISVDVQPNTFTAIMGPSGSGKSTLLHCMAGLDAPTSGRVFLGATDLTALPEKKLTRLRRDRVGFVFQSYALLPQLSVRQNIVLPLEVAGRKIDDQWLRMVVEALDLGKCLKQRATRLSGGQQQRVAMARALLPRPDVVFADEPTGALDAPTAREMLQFLRTSVHELGQTIVMVTHDPLAAEHTDHVLLLHQGGLAAQIANPTAPVVLEALTILDRMPAAGWQTGGYRAAMAAPAALPAAPRLALPAGSSAARPA